MNAAATIQSVRDVYPCPAWCADDCTGGEIETFSTGQSVSRDVVHEKTIARMAIADGDSYHGRVKVDTRIFVDRYDSLDPSEPAQVTRAAIDLARHEPATFIRLELTAAELRQLAAAALAAADLIDG